MDKSANQNPTIIKKYANRRLYNTATSVYVTLDDLCTMVQRGEDFVVQDAKSGDDLTRSVLAQIIMEQESKGDSLLPISFLRQVITYYDDQMKVLLPGYLDQAMQQFLQHQEQIKSYVTQSLSGRMGLAPGFPKTFEELANQNMQMFDGAMRQVTTMFLPFSALATGQDPQQLARMHTLQNQLNELNEQIETLSHLKRMGK